MAGKDNAPDAPVFSDTESRVSVPAHRGVFAKEGEFWKIAYEGDSFALKHSKGLAYLAQLLKFPGTEFHVLDLVGIGAGSDASDFSARMRSSLPHDADALASSGIHLGGLGDGGEMLDEEAKAQYRRRLTELREELDEVKRLGNIEGAERAEAEIESLTAELSRAVGLGGRNRRAASASERARQSVTHAIKSAIERIAEHHSQLGVLLLRCIRTGNSCAYYPDSAIPVVWEFAASGKQQPTQVSGDSTTDDPSDSAS
jgi:hypothetical protein